MGIIAAFFAQVATDPISGGSGWAGCGLLGLVLMWLCFFHLPAKDKQIKDITECNAAAVQVLMTANDRRVDALQVTFRAAIDSVVAHCQTEMRNVDERMNARQEADRIDRHELIEKVNAAWLKTAAELARVRSEGDGPRPPRHRG